MIWQLMKRDGAWKFLPWLVLAMAASMAAWKETAFVFAMAIALGALSFSVVQGQDYRTGFLAALPVRREEIYLARVAAIFGLFWIPGLASSGIAISLGRTNALDFLLPAAITLPLALGNEGLAVQGRRMPTQAVFGFMMAVNGLYVWFVLGHRGGLPSGPILLIGGILSLGLFLYTWNSIPMAGVPGPALIAAAAKAKIAKPFHARRFPWWLLSWQDLFWIGVLGNMTLCAPWANSLLFLWTAMIPQRERFRFLDSLPISRRVWLAARVFPMLLALAGGYLLGIYLNAFPARADNFNKVYLTAGREWPPTRVTSACRTLNVSPPLEYWIAARGGAAPLVRAPWGESYQTPVVRIYGYAVYNPYGVGCENSKRFFDWQYERASMAVYGKLMPRNDWRVTAKPRLRSVILNVGGILTFGLLAMMPLMVNDWWRFQKLRKPVRYGVLGTVFVLAYAALMLPLLTSVFSSAGFLQGNPMQIASWWLPESMAVVVCACIAVPGAVYLLMQRLLLASELGSWRPAGNYN